MFVGTVEALLRGGLDNVGRCQFAHASIVAAVGLPTCRANHLPRVSFLQRGEHGRLTTKYRLIRLLPPIAVRAFFANVI